MLNFIYLTSFWIVRSGKVLEKVAFVCVYPYLLVRKISFRDDSFFAAKSHCRSASARGRAGDRVHRTDGRGVVYGACPRVARRPARTYRGAVERQYPQKCDGRRDSRYGNDRAADRRGARRADRAVGMRVGGVARRDARSGGACARLSCGRCRVGRAQRGDLRDALCRSALYGGRTAGRSGDRGFAHPLRLSGLRRRGRARPPDGCVVARGRAVRTVDAATGFRLCADGADRRTGVHRRGAPAQYGCGRIGIGRRIRSFAGADAARPEGAARHGRQPLFPDAGLYFRATPAWRVRWCR